MADSVVAHLTGENYFNFHHVGERFERALPAHGLGAAKVHHRAARTEGATRAARASRASSFPTAPRCACRHVFFPTQFD